jgi:hypothetical protein
MTKELYEFLKSKDLEFCYSGKEPILVNTYVNVEYLQEYADLINGSLKSENRLLGLMIENGLGEEDMKNDCT